MVRNQTTMIGPKKRADCAGPPLLDREEAEQDDARDGDDQRARGTAVRP